MAPAVSNAEPLLGAPEDGPAVHPSDTRLTLTASRMTIDPEAQQGATERAAEAKRLHRRELYGLFLNALSTVFGTGMSLFAKVSGSQGIGVFEIVLTRSLILVLFTGPELLYFRTNPFRDRNRRWLLVLRGVLGFLSVSSLYLAVSLLPLADASVLSFLSPLFVAALSPFVLREKTSKGVLLGIPVALVGVIMVAQPSFIPIFHGSGGGISIVGVAVGVCQALFNSLARMSVRALSIGSSERMASIIFGQGAVSCVGAAIMCSATRKFVVPQTAAMWGPLLVGGFLGYLYQLALTGGLQRARAAPAVAMSYLSVIWGIIADIFVFNDLPDSLSLAGAGIICLSSLFVALSQRKAALAAKEAVAAAAAEDARRARLGGPSASAGSRLGSVMVDGLREPLLAGVDEEEGRRSRLSALSSSGEWASAAEGGLSPGVSLRSAASWRTAGGPEDGDGDLDGLPALKAEVKEALALAAAGEVQEPDTPAAPALLNPHASVESLPPLGSSPGAASQGPWLPGGVDHPDGGAADEAEDAPQSGGRGTI